MGLATGCLGVVLKSLQTPLTYTLDALRRLCQLKRERKKCFFKEQNKNFKKDKDLVYKKLSFWLEIMIPCVQLSSQPGKAPGCGINPTSLKKNALLVFVSYKKEGNIFLLSKYEFFK